MSSLESSYHDCEGTQCVSSMLHQTAADLCNPKQSAELSVKNYQILMIRFHFFIFDALSMSSAFHRQTRESSHRSPAKRGLTIIFTKFQHFSDNSAPITLCSAGQNNSAPQTIYHSLSFLHHFFIFFSLFIVIVALSRSSQTGSTLQPFDLGLTQRSLSLSAYIFT